MIEEPARSLATSANFAAFTTLLPDGTPMTHVMWVDCDGEHLLINTASHRTKFRNVLVNPVVAVTIWDRDDPYRYAEVRGRVVAEVHGDLARDHIEMLSQRYLGMPYTGTDDRVLLKIAPTRQRAKVQMAEALPPPIEGGT